VVTDAQDDVAASALTEAKEEVTNFRDQLKADARDKAGYKDFVGIAKYNWD